MNLYNLLSNQINQQDLLNYYNANITYAKLPKGINGFVYSYKGIQNIYINQDLSYYKRKKTLLHELAHIELNQLNQYTECIAFKRDKYEDEADQYLEFLKNSIVKNK